MKTTRDLINYVRNHLVAQGERCANERGNCLYKFGTKSCAIGCLIDDDLYRPDFEGNSVMHCNVEMAVSVTHRIALSDEQLRVLRKLQYIHDERDPKHWGTFIARYVNSLELSVLDEPLKPAKYMSV
jgi:hypothetical protein